MTATGIEINEVDRLQAAYASRLTLMLPDGDKLAAIL
jgi:hypothetical protein